MVHVLKQTQFLPISVEAAWTFFSRPENLNEITPPDLGFQILSKLPEKMYPGMIIIYRVSVFKGITFEWLTEITHMEEPHFFVDEQREGPYKLWHHEHHFKEVAGGVEMTDIVHYKLPMGWVGNLFHGLLVKPKLDAIFSHRLSVLKTKFNN